MFQKLTLDSSDINIDELANNVMLGPQREILELVEDFNHNFDTDIGVTKTFRWSPGIYDKIRRIYTSFCLGWDIPTRKVDTFFNKIENSRWMTSRMASQLRDLDNKLYNMRADSIVFQDNNDLVKEKFLLIQETFQEQLALLNDSIDIEVFLDQEELDNNQTMIYFLCSISKEYPLDVFVSGPDRDKHLVQMKYPWPIEMCFQVPLVQWLNKLCTVDINSIVSLRERWMTSRSFVSKIGLPWKMGASARYIGNEYSRLHHPYFQSRQVPDRNTFRYVCLGEMESNLKTSLLQLDLNSFMYHVKRWAGCYVINRTNPMNNITTFYYGKPDITKDFYDIVGSHEISNCLYPRDHMPNEVPYCDIQSCQYRSECSWYMDNFEDDIADKKIAYLALISEMSKDKISNLKKTVINRFNNIVNIYYNIERICKDDQRLFCFMLFMRDIKSNFRQKNHPYTISSAYDELCYWFDLEHHNPDVDMILEDSDQIIKDTFSFLIREMEEHGVTFKGLEINFELLNDYYKWIDTSKMLDELPVWIDTKKNAVVSHNKSWIQGDDGIWRKIGSEIPF